MRHLQPVSHPDLIVGLATGDDAAVWRRPDGRALIATVDFMTPIVDDARTFGAIAANNSASDVFAMGGTPLFALNIAAWPRDTLPLDLLGDILLGAQDAANAGGWIAVGGHTIDGAEPLFGQVVIGEIMNGEPLTNVGVQPGDALVLTKALGVGVITTAVKRGLAPADAYDSAVTSMLTSNAQAAVAARHAGAHAMTDVTGFGLIGHLHKMLIASGVSATLHHDQLPTLSGVRALIEAGVVPGGTGRNREFVGDYIAEHHDMLLLADPQTSGGLLFACPPALAEIAVLELVALGHPAAIIGHAHQGRAGYINVTA